MIEHKNTYLLSLFIILLFYISVAKASEYGKCILKAKINGCTRYFSTAWNTYVNLNNNRVLYVSFAPASDSNIQYSNDIYTSWKPDLIFVPNAFQNPDYKWVNFSPDKRQLKREEIMVTEIQVLDYAQSLNYNNKSYLGWSITRNDHDSKAWTIEFNYPFSGTYHTVKAVTDDKDSNLQCKIMYYSDEFHYNYNSYYTDRIMQGLVNYDPDQKFVVGNNKEFNKLVIEYKSSQPVSDSCSVS